jgi:hypothetical protein
MLQCIYDFFRDQGSIIAGLLAVVAGWIAVKGTMRAADKQVAAIIEQKNQTHDDAVAQIKAVEQQIDQRNREIADMRRREKVEIVRALATESARLDRLAQDRLQLAEGSSFSDRPDSPFGRDISPYTISAHDVLNKVNVTDFAGTGIMEAATILNSMVDVLPSALESAGVAGALKASALIGHLRNVSTSALMLKEKLEAWEANNPTPE